MSQLTAGRSQACGTANPGGVARAWASDRADVASVTVDATTKDYTAITMASGKKFYEFQFLEETLEFTEEGAISNSSEVFTQQLGGTWSSWSQTDRNRLLDLYRASRCGMVVIAEFETGDCILFGINPEKPTVTGKYTVKMAKSSYKTGKKFDDANGNELSLTARTTVPASKFTPGAAGVPLS